MNINIYQIDMEQDSKRISFFGLEDMKKLTGESTVDSSIYNKVFSGEVECETLEDVYQMFNIDHPSGYKGRSLSVSDVVEITDGTDKGFYFCDNVGYEKIDFDSSACKDLTAQNKISVLLVQVDKKPKVVEISGDLASMQKLVGGYIEEYMPFEDEVAIICNEEGKMNGMRLNRAIYDDQSNEMIEIIAGDFFIAYAPVESENFKSLPKDLEKKYSEKFKYPERFYRQNGEIKVHQVKQSDRSDDR